MPNTSNEHPFTVVLLWPDYLGDYGEKTTIHQVLAKDYAHAARKAQEEHFAAHTKHDPDAVQSPEDFYPLAIFAGHHENLLGGGEEGNSL